MTTIFLGWQENKKVSRSKNETYTDDWAFWFISTLIRCLLGSLYGSSLGKVTDLCYRLGFSMLCEIWGNWCLEKTFWDTNSLFYLNTREGGGWKRSLSWASRVQIQALQCIYLLQFIYLFTIYLFITWYFEQVSLCETQVLLPRNGNNNSTTSLAEGLNEYHVCFGATFGAK